MDCRNLTQFLLPCLKRVAVEPGLHEISLPYVSIFIMCLHYCLSTYCRIYYEVAWLTVFAKKVGLVNICHCVPSFFLVFATVCVFYDNKAF